MIFILNSYTKKSKITQIEVIFITFETELTVDDDDDDDDDRAPFCSI
jgi:hypothetical protein